MGVIRSRDSVDRPLSGRRELATIALVYGVYLGARAVGALGGTERAHANAEAIIGAERALGLDLGPALNELTSRDQLIAGLANLGYLGLHLPLFVTVALWLYLRRPAEYARLRRAVVATTLIAAAVFAAFPVAPPRLAVAGLIDVSAAQAPAAHGLLQPATLMNEYAAMPSLHLAWNVLVCHTLARCAATTGWRAAAVAVPVIMAIAVVATANHYVLDVPAGVAVAVIGLAVATRRPSPRAVSRPAEGRDSTGLARTRLPARVREWVAALPVQRRPTLSLRPARRGQGYTVRLHRRNR